MAAVDKDPGCCLPKALTRFPNAEVYLPNMMKLAGPYLFILGEIRVIFSVVTVSLMLKRLETIKSGVVLYSVIIYKIHPNPKYSELRPVICPDFPCH